MVTCADGYYSRPSAGSLGGCRGTGGVPWGYHGGTAKYRLPLVLHQQRLICLAKLDINIVIVPKSRFRLFPTKLEGIKKLLLEEGGEGWYGGVGFAW